MYCITLCASFVWNNAISVKLHFFRKQKMCYQIFCLLYKTTAVSIILTDLICRTLMPYFVDYFIFGAGEEILPFPLPKLLLNYCLHSLVVLVFFLLLVLMAKRELTNECCLMTEIEKYWKFHMTAWWICLCSLLGFLSPLYPSGTVGIVMSPTLKISQWQCYLVPENQLIEKFWWGICQYGVRRKMFLNAQRHYPCVWLGREDSKNASRKWFLHHCCHSSHFCSSQIYTELPWF